MTKTIELLVSPNGQTRLETKGFAGAGCQAVSQWLEAALGVKQSEQLTAEFHQPASANDRLSIQRGAAS